MGTKTKKGMVAFAISTLPLGAMAETWVYTPIITLGASYDDNFRLTTAPHGSVTGANVRAALAFTRVSDELSVDGRGVLDFNRYSGDKVPNENNQALYATIARRLELDTFKLFGSYKRDTTLKDINQGFDLNDPTLVPDPDAGITTTRIRRNTFRLLPSWKRQLDELTDMTLDYEYRNVSYKDGDVVSLNDYDSHRLRGTVSRHLTELDTGSVSVSYLTYNSDAANADYDSYSISVGFDHAFDETLKGGARLGWRSTNSDTGDDTGLVYELHVRKDTELAIYSAKLERRLAPSGTGDRNDTDQLLLQMKRSLSPTLDLNIRARYFKVDSNNDNNDRDYLSFEPGISWSFRQWWTLGFSYTYRRQKYDRAASSADGNTFYLSVSYAKPSGPTK